MSAAETIDRILGGMTVDLDTIDRTLADVDGPEDAATILAGLRDIKQDIARVYAEAEKHLLSLMGNKRLEVPGIGVVEAKRSIKRTGWRHDELWPVVVSRALDERKVDEETGEMLEREADVVARVLRECCTPSWKITGLRARGIQPDEWCTETPDAYSVVLPPRDEQQTSEGAATDAA